METEGPRKQLRHNLRIKHKTPPEALASEEGQLREEKKKHGYLTKKGKRSRRNRQVDDVKETGGPITSLSQVPYLTISYLLT
jgi:hypothetical protein